VFAIAALPLSLAVVMPVHNEAADLPSTIEALLTALAQSDFDAELVLVDDGSSDGSANVVREVVGRRVPLRVVTQPNRGRFEARRAGVEAADADLVLLLDGRVRVRPDALAFVSSRIAVGESVWTGHVHVASGANPFGLFWSLLAELAWAEYFDRPRTTSFGSEEFDRYPKGTTCFLAPRQLLLEAISSFRSRYLDSRRVNDDTPLIRWIAEREPVNISPRFACDYLPRTTLRASVKHAFHRGVVFLDGHGRRESRFFPVVVAFYPVSAAVVIASLRRPRVMFEAAALTALAASSLGVLHRRRRSEVLALAVVAPIYAAAHGAGMWRGLLMVRPRRSR